MRRHERRRLKLAKRARCVAEGAAYSVSVGCGGGGGSGRMVWSLSVRTFPLVPEQHTAREGGRLGSGDRFGLRECGCVLFRGGRCVRSRRRRPLQSQEARRVMRLPIPDVSMLQEKMKHNKMVAVLKIKEVFQI